VLISKSNYMSGGSQYFPLDQESTPFETALIDSIPFPTLIATDEGEIVYAGEGVYKLLGYPDGKLVGATIEDLIPERYRDSHKDRRKLFAQVGFQRPMGKGAYFPAKRFDGTEILVDISIGQFSLPPEANSLMVISLVDRSESAEREDNLLRIATTDTLTTLMTRRAFLDQAEKEFDRCRRNKSSLAVIYFDVDHFKKINDSNGHAVGDLVLFQVGQTCHQVFRNVDTVGRLGGEEFAAILPDTNAAGAQVVAERLRVLLTKLAIKTIEECDVSVSASFGVTEYLDSDVNLHAMLARADKAMYQAKQSGRNTVFTL